MASSKASQYQPAGSTRTLDITEKSDLLDRCFEPESKICDIPATNTFVKSDAFDDFRPKPRTVLDYNISETEIKGERTQRTGITKFHVKQTSARYELPPPGYVFPEEMLPPPPPSKSEKNIIYSTGRGPIYEFIEDKWRRGVERRQRGYIENLKVLIKQRKRLDYLMKRIAHKNLMRHIGPDWFQELSPNQMKTVDNLKSCITKDVKSKSICNTEQNIAELGLVLRPNSRHIQMALQKCCECPVEFLLILYQLMNRNRTKYSLNDRLLLSGVVHLTMRETLKELHIRVPSPPRPLKQPKLPPKREKPKRYESPYLVPFTFVPEPRKHKGIYKNSHVQYPESPYFSYIAELKAAPENDEKNEDSEKDSRKKKKKTKAEERGPKIRKTKKQFGITNAQEKELVAELRQAQKQYNILAGHENGPLLHKPTIYISCDNGVIGAAVEDEAEEQSSEEERNATVSVEVKVTTDFDRFCQPIRKVCECKITVDENRVSKKSKMKQPSVPALPPCPEENGKELGKKTDTTQKPSSPAEVPKKETESPRRASKERKSLEKTPSKVPSRDLRKSSKSRSRDLGKIDKTAEPEEKTKSKGTLLEQTQPKSEKEQLIEVGKRDSMECKCKEELQKILESNQCQCERCKADRAAAAAQREKKRTSYGSGVQNVSITSKQKSAATIESAQGDEVKEEGASDENKQIAKPRKSCDCLEKYQAKVKMYEEMKKRFDAQHDLKTLQKQYVIGGVTHTPEGEPVYMLSGVMPQKECQCAQLYQEQLKEEKRLANMPKIPLGRQKYIISGVHETEQGNVFVLSGAAGIEDCTCLKMYKSFEKKHVPCLKAYEEYLKKIEIDKEEYMKELVEDGRFENVEGSSTADKIEEEGEGEEVESVGSKPERSNSQPVTPPKEEAICTCNEIEDDEVCECNLPDCKTTLRVDTDLDLTLEVNKKKKKKSKQDVCICSPNYDMKICQRFDPEECVCGQYGSSSSSSNSSSTVSEDAVELKRFLILSKMPAKLADQTEILKKALETLANDGFPLAKLPDVYKLPHFKLWMQLRSGKSWKQEDRFPFLMQSLGHWRHYSYCGRKVRLPKLDISPEEAEKYNWTHAKLVKKMAMEKDNWYYRKVRQANIGDGREFFPSTFSYEFPTSNFRDCFFAYTAAKEEECICWRPWYLHENKNLAYVKHCG